MGLLVQADNELEAKMTATNPFDVLKELNAYNEKLIESSSKLRTKLESKSRTLKNLKTLMEETNSIFQREDEGYLERMKNYNLDAELLNEPVKPLMPETKLKTAQSAAKLAERVLRSNPPSPGLPRSEKNQLKSRKTEEKEIPTSR